MTRQSEQVLESQLVERLKGLGYEYVKIKDESDLLKNLKTQIEKHNRLTLTDKEFDKV